MNNRKVIYDDFAFDSIAECVRYWQLKQFKNVGKLWELELQPKYILYKSFINWQGEKQRGLSYKPDFRYKTTPEFEQELFCNPKTYGDKEVVVVEDVKGHRTQSFVMRAKLLQIQYPSLHFYEVPGKTVWDGRVTSLPRDIALAAYGNNR